MELNRVKLGPATTYALAVANGYQGTLEQWLAEQKGEPGAPGKDGVTPHIGDNGNWYIGDTDTGVAAQGSPGKDGAPGEPGTPGANGATFTPSVSPEGNLSWTNDKGLKNPETVNIRGQQGAQGPQGAPGPQGERGPQGEKGDTGSTGPQGPAGLGVPIPTAEDAGKVPTVNADGTGYELAAVSGGRESEWALLGEIDISATGGGSIELTGLDNFTEFYCTWSTVKNESGTESGYTLYINEKQIALSVIPIKNTSSTELYGWSKIDFNGLFWQVQKSKGATTYNNLTINAANANYPYNHVMNVGKAVTFELSAPLPQFQAVSGIISIYGR